ncbi:MAG: sigma-54-dependent Fis family transcriptional regulator [Acidobacteria bacterium]|nr:sigma-54-dependent Fis family transcriptional regulator [Acidobacteriota bacterium]
MPKRILIYDDPNSSLSGFLEAVDSATQGKSKICVTESESELCDMMAHDWELVILDYGAHGRKHSTDTIERIRRYDADVPIVTIVPSDQTISRLYQDAGAADTLLYGPDFEDLLASQVQKLKHWMALIERNRSLKTANAELHQRALARYQMVGSSPQMLEVIRKIERVAAIPRPVLITGERGTGKELVARAIHNAGCSHDRPMIVVNCAAFSDELLESELFGHEKGAFTGAANRSKGKFEMAHGGSLFLDEIGHMSHAFQKKILRVVEYGTYRRVGGQEELRVETRIIAATNANLAERMKQGTFLSDLYDRLAFEVIAVPPLRERTGDLMHLAQYFMDRFMDEVPAFQGKFLSDSAIDAMKEYPFPGNVRELKNIIERAVYRDTTNEITPTDIGLVPRMEDMVPGGDFKERVAAFEQRLVQDAMKKCKHNQTEAAKYLGLSYHQFRYYWQKYGVDGSL